MIRFKTPDAYRYLCIMVFAVVLGMLFGLFMDKSADASCGSMPYIFTNHTSGVDASTTNANNSFLLGCATSVDNTQIGPAGIYASQIVPGSAATATFSSAYGWRLTSSNNNATPVTIIQSSAPAVDTWDVYNNALATKYVWIDSGGVLHTNAAPLFGAALGVSSGGTGSSAYTANTCLRFDGTKIASAAVDCTPGVTSASSPLSVSGSTVSLTGTVPIANGGTGMTALAGSKCIRSASNSAMAEASGDCPVTIDKTGTYIAGKIAYLAAYSITLSSCASLAACSPTQTFTFPTGYFTNSVTCHGNPNTNSVSPFVEIEASTFLNGPGTTFEVINLSGNAISGTWTFNIMCVGY